MMKQQINTSIIHTVSIMLDHYLMMPLLDVH